MKDAMSFSTLYFSRASVAQSTASYYWLVILEFAKETIVKVYWTCCISSDMSAFFITAFLSDILPPDEIVSEMRTMVMFCKNHSYGKHYPPAFQFLISPRNYMWCTSGQHHYQTVSNMTQKMHNSTNSNVHKTWINGWMHEKSIVPCAMIKDVDHSSNLTAWRKGWHSSSGEHYSIWILDRLTWDKYSAHIQLKYHMIDYAF